MLMISLLLNLVLYLKNQAEMKSTCGLSNKGKVRNICGDCAEVLPREVAALAAQNTPSVVVLDPPRKGCDKKVVDALLSAVPDEIVYISCNPATLARDVALLMQKYDITSVTPYDMFPQTKHVETLICLERK